MSLSEKVGQMFFVRCPVTGDESQNLAEIEALHPGGYLLFADFFKEKTPETAKAAIASYQTASKTPMFIGVDEEGGEVVRVSKYPAFRETPFETVQALFQRGGLPLIASDAREKSSLLSSLGINVNFAPTADVSENPKDYIYERTFGKSANETAEYIRTVIAVTEETGMGSVLKHFPGYGSNGDTHKKTVSDIRSYEELTQCDFLPFLAGIDAGADCILVSHIVVSCLDAEMPASLSPAVHALLRQTFQFDGPIITDDLNMDAISGASDPAEAAVAAVLAGNDLICTGQQAVQIPAVIAAVQDGRIQTAQIDSAVLRVLRWKQELGLI